jgi:hypothetical protein
VVLPIIRVHLWRDGCVSVRNTKRRIVAQLLIVKIEIDRVKAKSVDATLHPERRDIQQFLLQVGVVNIQIMLLFQEIVHKVLHPLPVLLPGRATEN